MENKLYDTPKLKLREKMAYGIGELPNTMVSVLAAFLTMFYTDNVGMAAGSVGWILQLTGYVGDGSQSAATINGINMLFCYIPAIAFVAILVLFKIFYHYDEEEKVVLEELARRKQEKK